ncbi:MAG: hypothetical protein JSV05_00815 [Candidatus Bathyarchaeota archaeon]|nr:MAG: hypothetical protein JSV05_00815 [Candidatus Bathyarchaeota archaeon]
MHKKSETVLMTTFILISLFLGFFTILPLMKVFADDSLYTLIPSVDFVGTLVRVRGEIGTENGSYKIFFDDIEVKTGTAIANDVNDTFTVPNSTIGGHPVRIQDNSTGIFSNPMNFTVRTSYTIKALTLPHPTQMQEGANVTILAEVTGGETTINGNVTVKDPADVEHTTNITIPIGSDGYGETSKSYLLDFDENPHTFYVGTYELALNLLNQTLATGSFQIGLTNATQYHRFQTVHIQALNYSTNDILKILIVDMTTNETVVFESTPQNASGPDGKITANWTIPANASLGIYKVNVTHTTVPAPGKAVPDSQIFTIIQKSFACEVRTINLDNEPVQGVAVEAEDSQGSTIRTNISNEEGLASFRLEASNYSFVAYVNSTQVGLIERVSLSQNLTGPLALNVSCSLAHLKISVKEANEVALPFIRLSINFTFTTRTNSTDTETVTAETNLTGMAVFRNLFANTNYTVKASRYDRIFSTANINLTSTSWFNISCPTLELIARALDRFGEPLEGAQVRVYDWGVGLSGIKGAGDTNQNGEITFNLTFGRYIVHVYKTVLLNETNTYLTDQPTNFIVSCKLFNLTLDVNVQDYFGQGIPNANVTIEREGAVLSSKNTGGAGLARFTEIIGGNYRVLVRIGEKLRKISLLDLQEPTNAILKISEVVSIGGFIVETSSLVTVVLVVGLIGAFTLAIFYRRITSQRKE